MRDGGTDLRPRLVGSFTAQGRRHTLTAVLAALLTLFLVLFPKGGIKVGEVPLTWGYLLLGLTLPVLTVIRCVAFPLRLKWGAIAAIASLIPFLILFLFSAKQNGIASFGEAISTFTSLFVLPFAFLVIYPVFLPWVNGTRLERLFRFCILAAALFGIFLFFLYPLTGHLFEVPYLTVNAADYGMIEAYKHINRGAFLKLISTYNNGNVYGVATLILLPLYNHLEPRLWRRNLIKFALVLSLSRTVWFGLVAEQLLSLARLGANALRTLPRLVLGSAVKRGAFLLLTLGGVLVGLAFTSGNLAFLFDTQLGGRTDTLKASLQNISWLPAAPVQYFGEIIYASALANYGMAGLLAILLIFTLPIFLLLRDQACIRSPLRIAALKGLILYLILMSIDGALNYIPVMAFYWFAYMVFLYGWPGGTQVAASVSNLAAASNLAAGQATTVHFLGAESAFASGSSVHQTNLPSKE